MKKKFYGFHLLYFLDPFAARTKITQWKYPRRLPPKTKNNKILKFSRLLNLHRNKCPHRRAFIRSYSATNSIHRLRTTAIKTKNIQT